MSTALHVDNKDIWPHPFTILQLNWCRNFAAVWLADRFTTVCVCYFELSWTVFFVVLSWKNSLWWEISCKWTEKKSLIQNLRCVQMYVMIEGCKNGTWAGTCVRRMNIWARSHTHTHIHTHSIIQAYKITSKSNYTLYLCTNVFHKYHPGGMEAIARLDMDQCGNLSNMHHGPFTTIKSFLTFCHVSTTVFNTGRQKQLSFSLLSTKHSDYKIIVENTLVLPCVYRIQAIGMGRSIQTSTHVTAVRDR